MKRILFLKTILFNLGCNNDTYKCSTFFFKHNSDYKVGRFKYFIIPQK